jgi:formamidopyrimidine-DNA glycosylase
MGHMPELPEVETTVRGLRPVPVSYTHLTLPTKA